MSSKKTLIIGLIFTFLISMLSGCGFNTNKNQVEKSQDTLQKEKENDTSDKKTLVVYYSATGSTEAVANTIAKTLDADIFKLEPVDPYSDDDLNWSDSNSRVTKEHDDPDSRNVELTAATVDNWESYDTVFVGYPIWWGDAAWPINEFIKENDFTGKTVIPFCTSASSGIGESGELLKEMAGSGNWLEGKRFSSSVYEKDVQKWAESVN